MNDFDEWAIKVTSLGLKEKTIDLLREEDLDTIDMLKLLKNEDIRKLMISMGQKLVLKNILSDGVHLGKKVEPENLELFNSVIVTEEIKANDDPIIVSDDKKSDKVVPAKSAAGCSTEFPDTKKVDELLRSSKTLTKGTFKSHESGLLVCCIPCNTTITLGKEYKKLSNVYAHAGRLGHKNNVISYLEREKRKLANPSEVISSK